MKKLSKIAAILAALVMVARSSAAATQQMKTRAILKKNWMRRQIWLSNLSQTCRGLSG